MPYSWGKILHLKTFLAREYGSKLQLLKLTRGILWLLLAMCAREVFKCLWSSRVRLRSPRSPIPFLCMLVEMNWFLFIPHRCQRSLLLTLARDLDWMCVRGMTEWQIEGIAGVYFLSVCLLWTTRNETNIYFEYLGVNSTPANIRQIEFIGDNLTSEGDISLLTGTLA